VKSLSITGIVIALLLVMLFPACNTERADTHAPIPTSIPTNNGNMLDDIVYTPGGVAYRTPVEQVVETLVNGSDSIEIQYREKITSKPGEVHNNIFYLVDKSPSLAALNLALYFHTTPRYMKLTVGGGVGGA
jgi:hypothetical protein